MNIGILALQGAFAAHRRVLVGLGASVTLVRTPVDLSSIDGLVIPGGESTTMSMLLDSSGLRHPLSDRIKSGLPVFGTCAGLIVLAKEIVDGRSDQLPLDAIDVRARRNGYGRQIDSFETSLEIIDGLNEYHMNGVFIRAPRVESTTANVEILAEVDGDPVLIRERNVLAATFHPELGDSPCVHEMFLKMVAMSCDGTAQFEQVRS